MDIARKRILRRQSLEHVYSDGYIKKVHKSIERAERKRAKTEAIKEQQIGR